MTTPPAASTPSIAGQFVASAHTHRAVGSAKEGADRLLSILFNSTLDFSTMCAHLLVVVTRKAQHLIRSMSRQAQGWGCALNSSTILVSSSRPDFGTKEGYQGG
jgi:hypothetical protein